MNKLTKTMGKLRGFINAHAKVSERKDAAKWIDQVQELTTIEFNDIEVAYLHYFIKKLRNKKTTRRIRVDTTEPTREAHQCGGTIRASP